MLLAVGAAVAAFPSPAQADPWDCKILIGTPANNNDIELCFRESLKFFPGGPGKPSSGFTLETAVGFGISATKKTTKCKVTARAELQKIGSAPWSTGAVTKSCTDAVLNPGTYKPYFHLETATFATHMRSIGCIDLYYNGSSTSGWQRCYTTAWHERPG
ncbi:hypothetical protein AMIS_34080 [Actinoplanes missouriensis 431]|uniref:Secreted protein n=2 Tax=Actinoplanes missouriensis TaxID=1866 RepID=I0H6J1_ACTM4|nr:hypothetical protein AMIS_34080 [Actinoplanes missouriensis 431]